MNPRDLPDTPGEDASRDQSSAAHGDSTWLQASRRALDASADALDAQARSRLNRARQQALAVARQQRSGWRLLALPLAAAAVLAIAVLAWRDAYLPAPLPGPGDNASAVAAAEAWATLVTAATTPPADAADAAPLPDDPALYEDLEFYAWLASELPAEPVGS